MHGDEGTAWTQAGGTRQTGLGHCPAMAPKGVAEVCLQPAARRQTPLADTAPKREQCELPARSKVLGSSSTHTWVTQVCSYSAYNQVQTNVCFTTIFKI